MEIQLQQAHRLPPEINVTEIAIDALNACFASIASSFAEHGYKLTGDFDPFESWQLDNVSHMFVRAMALNCPEIAALNEGE